MSDRDHSRAARKRPPSVLAKIVLDEGLSSGSCPICYATRKTLRRYLHSFLYEGMMSPIARQDFLDGGGFCREHFWQAKGIEEECWADGIGVSILCENLLDVSFKSLAALAKRPNGLTKRLLKIRDSLKAHRPTSHTSNKRSCLACKVVEDTDKHYLSTLEGLMEDAGFCGRFRNSVGLCLRHTQIVVEQWTSVDAVEHVRRSGESQIRNLLNQLREFQRKHDYRHRHEPRGLEWSSPERTIEFLVGPAADFRGFGDLQVRRRTRR